MKAFAQADMVQFLTSSKLTFPAAICHCPSGFAETHTMASSASDIYDGIYEPHACACRLEESCVLSAMFKIVNEYGESSKRTADAAVGKDCTEGATCTGVKLGLT